MTAKEWIEKINDQTEPTKTLDIFRELCETADVDTIMEVHSDKEVQKKIVRDTHLAAGIDYDKREEEERIYHERRKREIAADEAQGIYQLRHWQKLVKKGILQNEDLVLVDIDKRVFAGEDSEVDEWLSGLDIYWQEDVMQPSRGKCSFVGTIFVKDNGLLITAGYGAGVPAAFFSSYDSVSNRRDNCRIRVLSSLERI